MVRFVAILIIILCVLVNTDEMLSHESWIPVSSPTTQKLVSLHFVDSSTGWAAGDSGTIIHTPNGGETWEVQTTNSGSNIVDIFFLDRNNGWALAWSLGNPTGTVILKTNNGGAEWVSENYQQSNKFMEKIFFMDSLNGVMGGGPSSAFVYTDDGGVEWNPVTIDSGSAASFPVLNFKFYDKQYGFANGGKFDLSGVIWKTINGGKNWYSQAVGPEPIQELIIFDSLNAIGVGGDFEYGTAVVRTNDAGQNWEYTSLQIFGIAFGVSFRTPAEGWACLGSAKTLIVTYDSAKTWHEVPSPDNSELIDLVFADSIRGYAVGYQGVIYEYDTSVVGISPPLQETVPATNRLFQNFPNPFNPSTTIEFRIAKSGIVRLSVYDILGREVAVLVNKKLPPGWHSAAFSGEHLSSGIYYSRLLVMPAKESEKTFTQTRKMILLK